MLGIVTRTPFPAPVTFTTRVGSVLSGYDPALPNVAVITRSWSVASGAHARASVHVSWPGDTTPPVPRGGPFLEVIDGVYAGLIIVAGQVDWTPPPALDLATVRQAGYAAGRNIAIAAVHETPAVEP
jgi:hypothetical protein